MNVIMRKNPFVFAPVAMAFLNFTYSLEFFNSRLKIATLQFPIIPIRGGCNTDNSFPRMVLQKSSGSCCEPDPDDFSKSRFYPMSNSNIGDATSLLWKAARFGSCEMLADAVQSGADVNARNPAHCRWGALHYAVHHDDPHILSMLVNSGARLDLPCNLRVRAMHLAAINGSSRAVTFLLNSGANPQPADQYGKTPLHCAASAGHLNIVKQLLAAGVNIDAKDFTASTPLASAARNGHTDVVRLLVSYGADVQIEDRLGDTACGSAVKKGHFASAAACRFINGRAREPFFDKSSFGELVRNQANYKNISREKVGYHDVNFWCDEIIPMS
jgi:hypothetical protein